MPLLASIEWRQIISAKFTDMVASSLLAQLRQKGLLAKEKQFSLKVFDLS
ncbi:hypothetical protein BofuT4_P078670.1 [Botrytis cinerea T4]|uniref:Uncharacterized protein n=1 Tax=Botryotinia fuckeliana (strain T4) TaxID=999810 RepID=G2YL54_BOTF4|nr:hypothetical protein BofuT4_P078670.1 [Botrytis cinerea T4]